MPRMRKCPGCGIRKRKGLFRIAPERTSAETAPWAKMQLCTDCQRKQPVRGLGYAGRDFCLRRLGFSSYAEYLQSPQWAKIRLRVLRLRRFTCEVCGLRATQVHHNRYDIRILRGQSLKGLKAICAGCHREIEFSGTAKLSSAAASHKFYAIVGRGNGTA